MKPLPLRPTIGIVALSSPTDPKSTKIPLALSKLESLGCTVILGETVWKNDGYRSASINDRVRDIRVMFENPAIDAVFTTTGGFNCNELLEYIPWDLVRNNPKWFVGYSDMTIMNLTGLAMAGIPTVQGPMLIDEQDDGNALSRLLRTLQSTTMDFSLPPLLWDTVRDGTREYSGLRSLPGKKGTGRGPLIAANVSTCALLLGTKYMPEMKNAVLFLEFDKCEDRALPSLQRFLWQFRQAGMFDGVRGLVFGSLQAIVAKEETETWTIRDILAEVTQGMDFPVIYHAPFGHVYPSWVLMNGVEISVETLAHDQVRISAEV